MSMQTENNKIQLEIERKFVIVKPDLTVLEGYYGIKKTEIVQTYLTSADSVTRRVRKTLENNDVCYIYNEKTPVNGMTRLEKEIKVSESDYRALLKEAEPLLSTIIKTRYTLPYMGFLYEIDIYPFSRSRAILEVELPEESITPPLPPDIIIIKEVTEDKAYSNFDIAKTVPQDLTI